MKKLTFFILMCCFCLTARSQENITSNNLSDFNEIVLTGKLNVTLVESEQNGLEIKLINADASKLVWSCTGGKLNVKLKANTQKDGSADVTIYYKRFTSLKISNGTLKTESAIVSGILNLHTSNEATVTAEIESKDFSLHAEGNSAVSLSGDTDYLTIKATSKAKVDARALESKSAIVLAQTASEVFVWGTDKLDATAGSNSVIYYKGTPEVFKATERTFGAVEQFSY